MDLMKKSEIYISRPDSFTPDIIISILSETDEHRLYFERTKRLLYAVIDKGRRDKEVIEKVLEETMKVKKYA